MYVAREGGIAKCLSMGTSEHSCSQPENYSVSTINNCLPTFDPPQLRMVMGPMGVVDASDQPY